MNSSQQPPVPGRGRGDPSHIAPFLTPLVTQPEQLAYVSPQNAGRTRKSAKSKLQSKIKEDRRREFEEPRFNIGVPVGSRTRKPQQRTPRAPAVIPSTAPYSRDTMIPDDPPPTFQEAISESSPPPFIVIPAITLHTEAVTTSQNSEQLLQPVQTTSFTSVSLAAATSPGSTLSSLPVDPSTPDPSHLPSPQSPSSLSQQTNVASDVSDNTSDTSSIELVDLSQSQDDDDRRLGLSQEWKADRRRGIPLTLRMQRDYRRRYPHETIPVVPSASPRRAGEDIALHTPHPPHRCSHCGHSKSADCAATQFPSRYSPEVVDVDSSPPMSPRSGRSMWRKLFAPIVPSDLRAGPSSPITSPRSPLAGLPAPWASSLTLNLGGASPALKASTMPQAKRKDSFSVKKLFGSKGKERESSPEDDGADSWELLDQSSLLSDSDSASSPGRGVNSRYKREAPPAGNLHVDTHPQASVPVAFLNRPVRQSPQPVSKQVFSSSTVNLLPTASAVNLPSMLQVPLPTKKWEKGREKTRHPSPLLSSVQREVTASSSVSLPNTVGKVFLPSETAIPRHQGSSLLPRQRSHSEGRHAVLSADNGSTIALDLAQPSRAESPVLARLTVPPSQTSRGIVYDDYDAELMSPLPQADNTASTPDARSQVALATSKVSDLSRPSAIATPPRAPSSPLPESPPRTPTTPTRHYPGRPLPHPPVQPSPRAVLPAITAASSELFEYSHYTDLDQVASKLVEDDYKSHPYEDNIFELPDSVDDEISFADVSGQRLSTVGRVELQRRDNRVQLKRILMGHEVDKCCLCGSQFREDDEAVLGTNCYHAFHEECLNRRYIPSNTCPLCRKPVS